MYPIPRDVADPWQSFGNVRIDARGSLNPSKKRGILILKG